MAAQPPPPPPPRPEAGQPPPAAYNAPAPPAPPAPSAAPPPPSARRGGCAGCGCGGCLLSLLVLVVVVGGAIWWFAIRPAFAAAPAPAVLTVYLARVEVGHSGTGYAAGRTGQQVSAGGSVRTDAGGRASLLFPDGSITRLAGSTELTLSEETLTSKGALNRVTLQQSAGRTFSTVQKLAPGSGGFSVRGRHLNTEVRGTQFEVYQRADGSILVKLFAGRLQVGGASGSATLGPGQQVLISPAGALGTPGAIAPEPGDPFTSWAGPTGAETAALSGNQAGTEQTMPGAAPIAAANVPVDTGSYAFPGGDLTATLSYPGSLMRLEVVGPSGKVVASAQGPPPVRISIANAPPGMYRGRVTGVVLDHGPEAWTVAFAANPPCRLADQTPPSAPGAPVRMMLSDALLNARLNQGGLAGASIRILPSSGGGIVSGSLNAVTATVSVTAALYASAPGIGVALTQFSVNGINLTVQVGDQLAHLQGTDLGAISTSFAVDRVYSCQGPDGGLLVVEGHGQP